MTVNWREKQKKDTDDTAYLVKRMLMANNKSIIDKPKSFDSFGEMDNYIEDRFVTMKDN